MDEDFLANMQMERKTSFRLDKNSYHTKSIYLVHDFVQVLKFDPKIDDFEVEDEINKE